MTAQLDRLMALREGYARLPASRGAQGRKALRQAWYMEAYKLATNPEHKATVTSLIEEAEIVLRWHIV